MRTTVIRLLLSATLGFAFINLAQAITPEQIIAALKRPENSTGNIADAVEEATGARGWMSADMKPIYDARIVGRAATALMRPVLKNDTRKYTNHILDILDEAPAGSVLVYVMQDGLEIAAMGNLMGTTAKVRGLAGAVIDGAGCAGALARIHLAGMAAPLAPRRCGLDAGRRLGGAVFRLVLGRGSRHGPGHLGDFGHAGARRGAPA